jgi:MYXO-CTERM domain-containing protein
MKVATLMPKSKWFALVAVCGLLCTAGSARADYIVNGGFETGDFTGWTVNANSTAVESSFAGYLPNSGSFFAALGNVGLPLGTLSQTFTDTPGQTLIISMYLASNGTTPNEFKVIFDGVTLSDQFNITPQGYTLLSYTVTATGTDTLTLGERNDPNYLALDDVSVNPSNVSATPAPPSAVLLAIGGVGLLGTRLRRRVANISVA